MFIYQHNTPKRLYQSVPKWSWTPNANSITDSFAPVPYKQQYGVLTVIF